MAEKIVAVVSLIGIAMICVAMVILDELGCAFLFTVAAIITFVCFLKD